VKIEKVIISDQAILDLEEIWQYIGNDNPVAADEQIERIYEQCLLLKDNPEIGRKREELYNGLRSIVVSKYILFYRIKNEVLEIVRILSGYRDIDSLF
jgi:toxin ParE1/3/4